MTLSGSRCEPTRMEVLGSAAAGIVHDINNELTMVLNHIAMSGLPTTHADGARAAVARCVALTNGLLAYCRCEALTMRRLDPIAFVREFAYTLHLPSSIQLNLNLPGESPAIMANGDALTQVLNNLILNAREAMHDAGEITLSVSGHRIRIEDSGPGITQVRIPDIFRHFFSTKGDFGAGLGLSVVRELMQQQGGSVTVTSEPGSGAVFELGFKG